MNPNVPLEVFLPPPEKEVGGNRTGRDVNLIVTNDRHGLNNGVFFLRVSEWAVRFLSASLSLREWDAHVTLKYSEQSAMEIVGGRVRFFLFSFLFFSLNTLGHTCLRCNRTRKEKEEMGKRGKGIQEEKRGKID